MTGSEFRDYVVRIFKRIDKDTEIYEAITDKLAEILSRARVGLEDFKCETYCTGIATLGDYRLDLPSDFGILVGELRLINGATESWVLQRRSKTQFDNLYPDPNSTSVDKGPPLHYCIFGNQILIGPVPDKITYQYEFSYSEGTVTTVTSATADVPYSGLLHRQMLRSGVLAELYEGLGNDNEQLRWERKFEKALETLISRENKNTDGNESQQYVDI